jgi:Na+/H+-dicarboxylate symporter
MGRSATNVMSNAMGAAIVGRWEGEHFGAGCRGKVPAKESTASETEIAMY